MRGAVTGTSRRRVLVALLTAATLLLCHGIYGASHVLADNGASHPGKAQTLYQQSVAHHSPAEHAVTVPAADGGQASAGHAGSAGDYFAVLLILAGVAMLALVRAAVDPVRRVVSRVPWSHRHFGAGTLRQRALAPPLLQVFRL